MMSIWKEDDWDVVKSNRIKSRELRCNYLLSIISLLEKDLIDKSERDRQFMFLSVLQYMVDSPVKLMDVALDSKYANLTGQKLPYGDTFIDENSNRDMVDLKFLFNRICIQSSLNINPYNFLFEYKWDLYGAPWALFQPICVPEIESSSFLSLILFDSYIRRSMVSKYYSLDNLEFLLLHFSIKDTIFLTKDILNVLDNMESCKQFDNDGKIYNVLRKCIVEFDTYVSPYVEVFYSKRKSFEVWGQAYNFRSNDNYDERQSRAGYVYIIGEEKESVSFLSAIINKQLPICRTLSYVRHSPDSSKKPDESNSLMLGLISMCNSSCRIHETMIPDYVSIDDSGDELTYTNFHFSEGVSISSFGFTPYLWNYDDNFSCQICDLHYSKFWNNIASIIISDSDLRFEKEIFDILIYLDIKLMAYIVAPYTKCITKLLYVTVFEESDLDIQFHIDRSFDDYIRDFKLCDLKDMNSRYSLHSDFRRMYSLLINFDDRYVTKRDFLALCEAFVRVTIELGSIYNNLTYPH